MDKEILEKTINKNGIITQSIIAIEECAELIQAICKCLRSEECVSQRELEHQTEEMADVMICLEQLKMMYHITDDQLKCWLEFKTKRLECRLNEK